MQREKYRENYTKY